MCGKKRHTKTDMERNMSDLICGRIAAGEKYNLTCDTLLLQNSTEVTGLIDSQQKWKISCEEAFNEVMKSVELLIVDLNENKESIYSETGSIREYQKAIQFCVNDVKKSTDEYVKLVQEANVSLFESFAIFKNDFLTASNEQIRLLSEIKDEQLKQKKMYLLGLIPAIVIIVLQIINILI